MPKIEEVAAENAANGPDGPSVPESVPVQDQPEPSEEARQTLSAENLQRSEEPSEIVVREANPEFGGESFSYGGK